MCTPCHFNSKQTNIILYEIRHLQLKFDTLLRLLGLKLRSWEVAEMVRVQAKKGRILDQDDKFSYKNALLFALKSLWCMHI